MASHVDDVIGKAVSTSTGMCDADVQRIPYRETNRGAHSWGEVEPCKTKLNKIVLLALTFKTHHVAGGEKMQMSN